jgi:hypothetical protein
VTKTIDDYEPGTLYRTADGAVWELVGIFDRPSLVFKNLRTGERMMGAINSPMANSFKVLAV